MLKWPLAIVAAAWALCCVGLSLEYYNRTEVVNAGVGVLQWLPGQELRDHERENRHRQGERPPEAATHVDQFVIWLLLE